MYVSRPVKQGWKAGIKFPKKGFYARKFGYDLKKGVKYLRFCLSVHVKLTGVISRPSKNSIS